MTSGLPWLTLVYVLPAFDLSKVKPVVGCQVRVGNSVFRHFKGHVAPWNGVGVPR